MNQIKTELLILSLAVILFTIITPVQAFTADSLSITVMDNGDARITFDYSLTFLEQIGVYLKVADPNVELKKALESNFHHPVIVEKVTDGSAQFLVEKFGVMSNNNGQIVIETPEISFSMAEEILQNYWFAPLVSPDYSPAITTITYPDGYVEKFYNQIEIPKTSHPK